MRCEGADVRAETLPVLLALRAGARSVSEEGGLHRAGGRRAGPPGASPADGRVPREGGAGDRTTTREDRADAGPPPACIPIGPARFPRPGAFVEPRTN